MVNQTDPDTSSPLPLRSAILAFKEQFAQCPAPRVSGFVLANPELNMEESCVVSSLGFQGLYLQTLN
jgi:hypothetical protein